ncbi:unnamed protein product, partial [Symbiodinium necroappetens]
WQENPGKYNLRVNDGDTLEISLRRTEDITDTESDDDDTEPDEDMEEDEESVLRSSDLSIGSPPQGPGPHGPPPPEPVNRQRSRSPRRSPEHTPEESGTTAATLELAKCVPGPSFDLQEDVVELPHEPQDIRQAFHVWPPDWFRDLQLPPKLKQETKKAMSDLVHWTKVLRAGMDQDAVEVDLYVDGSYFAKPRKSGYAVAVSLRCAGALALFGLFGEGILGNCSSIWSSSSPPALFAEQVALAGALLWIGQSVNFLRASSYKIYFDCQVAGYGTNGLWQGQDEFTAKLRALDRYVQGVAGQRISYEHVHSHRGHPWNELVDVAAKSVAVTMNELPAPPRDNCAAFLRLDMSWMATISRWGPSEVIQSRAGKWLVIPPKTAPQGSPLDSAKLVPLTSHNRMGRTSRGSTFSTKCATINVQGLRAKSKFLADQFEAGGYRIIFLQETKSTGGLWTPGTYMRFSTDSQKHWGTAIWLHRRMGFLDVNGQALEVDEHDVTIKAQEPRLLILEIAKGGMRCVLFSAHVPHHDKADERMTFLTALQQQLQAMGKADIIIGGMGGNGRVPCNIHPTTGSLEYGEPDEAGAHLVEMLTASNLWIPATFDELHCGPSETFCHANGQYHRIDYLVVGGSSWVSQVRSYTDHEIDMAAVRDDHYVASMDMVGQTWSDAATQKLWRPRYDREKMVTPEGKAILTAALEAYQPPPWWTHVDVHCQQVQEYVCQVLETHFPAPKITRTSYIPAEVWHWRDQKLALKRRTGQRKFMWARGLAAAFYQWSTGGKGLVEALVRKDGLLYQLAASAIGYATHRIKQAINIGKAQYLRTIVAEGPQSAASILQRAKRHGVGGRKRMPSSRPLPLLLDAKGNPARNQDDHDRIWLQHFGDQEYGKIMEPAAFLNMPDAAQKYEEGVVWTADDLPTVGEIKRICRTAPTNKAMGLDGIPGEVLRACPVSAAAALEPLFLKAAWGLQQPVQWRGGVIYSAWKQILQLLQTVGWNDMTWADDTALPFDDPDFGLQPNLKRGKTTIVVALTGKGIQKARQSHFGHGRNTLVLEDLGVEIPVAPQYVHLGGIMDAKLSMKPEMRRRLSMATSAMDSGKKLIFQNVQIPLDVRAQLFEMSVLSTMFNLSLWIPEGQAWKSLCQGYTRILRQLLCPRYPGDRIFTIPAPFVHIATNRWRLELHAVKSRLTILTAMVQTGPDLLWGVLQQEQQWFAVIRHDLEMMRTYFPELPCVTVAEWPSWWHYLKEQGGQFKYRVKKALHQEHEKQCRQDAAIVGIWHFYRQLREKMPGVTQEATTWGCRGCSKTFRSKGGLGAHFYKTHGREAAHRKCVAGSICRACGKQFWSTERLGVHLRTSRTCVNRLWRGGHTVETALPGQGSKDHRKRAVEEYNLAPTCQIYEPEENDSDEVWPEVQKRASREISEVLLEQRIWSTNGDLQDKLLAVLSRHPLYYSEECEVLLQAGADADILIGAGESPWDEESSHRVLEVLQQREVWHQQITNAREEAGAKEMSLELFQEQRKTIEWSPLLALCRQECGTPEPFLIILGPDWEASKARPSGKCTAEAALDDPLCFMPSQVGELWEHVCKGRLCSVVAPATFWQSPWGSPFASLKAD